MTDDEYWEYLEQRREEFERTIPKRIPMLTHKEIMRLIRRSLADERWGLLQELKGKPKWYVRWKMLPFELYAAHELFWAYYEYTPQSSSLDEV